MKKDDDDKEKTMEENGISQFSTVHGKLPGNKS
jgi:hypothetical protein